MTEQPRTHWRKLANPDFLGSYSLDEGKDMILTIKTVTREMVTGAEGKKDECTVARFKEAQKPMILNRTNCRVIQKLYGSPYIEDWPGKRIQIYVDHAVKVKGELTDGLRIRPFVPQQSGQAVPNCADCAKPIEPYQGVTAGQLANATLTKYGRPLCYDCSTIAKQAASKQADPLGAGQIGMEGAE